MNIKELEKTLEFQLDINSLSFWDSGNPFVDFLDHVPYDFRENTEMPTEKEVFGCFSKFLVPFVFTSLFCIFLLGISRSENFLSFYLF